MSKFKENGRTHGQAKEVIIYTHSYVEAHKVQQKIAEL